MWNQEYLVLVFILVYRVGCPGSGMHAGLVFAGADPGFWFGRDTDKRSGGRMSPRGVQGHSPGGSLGAMPREVRRMLRHEAKQELSYHQQIARQLRTQFAEAIYRHKYYTVTLKSRLRVTQGHWKRNHWIDHPLLSSSRVIWRWILLWPWNVG